MRHDHKPNVLIVDNDDRVLWQFQELLENGGFDTHATWSGHEALALLKSGAFDVLLVDDYLPDVHSHDFLQRVSRLPLQPSIIVMHSTPPKTGDMQSYASLGVAELVDKHDAAKVCKAVLSCCGEEALSRRTVH